MYNIIELTICNDKYYLLNNIDAIPLSVNAIKTIAE